MWSPPRTHISLCILAVVTALGTLAVYFLPALLRSDVYANDAAEHLSWMYHYSNPSVFANCPMRDYFSDCMAPFGFRWIYGGLAHFFDVQVASELLPFPLAILTIIGAFVLGRFITGGEMTGGVGGAAMVLFGGLLGKASNYMQYIAGGLQRSFALPILVWGVFAVVQRRVLLAGTMLIAASLLYPPVCLVLGLFQLLVWIVDCMETRRLPKGTLQLAVTGLTSMGVLLRLQAQASAYGPTLTLQEMARMPDFYPDGVFCTPIFFHNLWGYLHSPLPVSGPMLLAWIIGVGTVLFYLRYSGSTVRKETWLILLTGVVLFALAYVLLFQLHVPSRYTIYCALLFQLMIVPPLLVAIEHTFGERIRRSRLAQGFSKRALRESFVAVAIFVVVGASAWLVAYRFHTGRGGMTGDIPESVYAYLRSLPVDTCIAAHPEDANYVPLRSQRCVPLVADVVNIRQRDYRKKVFEQLGAILSLMYTRDTKQIAAMSKQLNCRMFLVNAARYANDPLATVKPTDVLLARLRQNTSGHSPLLLHPPENAVLFRDGLIAVVDLDRLAEDARPDQTR